MNILHATGVRKKNQGRWQERQEQCYGTFKLLVPAVGIVKQVRTVITLIYVNAVTVVQPLERS